MAKGRNLSSYQQKIVKRYYENKDAIMTQRLGEIVTDLYLAEAGSAKAKRLWDRAEKAMGQVKVEVGVVRKLVDGQDVEGLAKLVGELG